MTLEIGSFRVTDVLALGMNDEDVVGDCIPALREFANSLETNQVRAEFLVQATVLQANEALTHLQPERVDRLWVFAILKDLHLEGRAAAMAGIWQKHYEDAEPETDRFCRHFRSLSDTEQVVMALVVVSGFRVRKVAGILGQSEGFVRRILCSARQRLLEPRPF